MAAGRLLLLPGLPGLACSLIQADLVGREAMAAQLGLGRRGQVLVLPLPLSLWPKSEVFRKPSGRPFRFQVVCLPVGDGQAFSWSLLVF